MYFAICANTVEASVFAEVPPAAVKGDCYVKSWVGGLRYDILHLPDASACLNFSFEKRRFGHTSSSMEEI